MNEIYAKRNTIKLGFAPTRRAISSLIAFNKDEARRIKDIVENKVKSYGIEYVNLDFLNEEGMLFDGLDAEKVAKKFREAEVDALFIPHCNFGSEDSVARLAKMLKKPVLLWGPRDAAPLPDGSRYTDSQCGMFATSKVLHRMGVEFTYITNCNIDDQVFDSGFKNFIAVASVVKSFTNMRLGQISTHPGSFWSVKSNEAELLERFGVEIAPIAMTDLKRMFDSVMNEKSAEKKETIDLLMEKFDRNNFDDSYLERIASLKLSIKRWMDAEKLTVAATACWAPMVETAGISPCFVLSELTDDGIPVICEGDIHGAITAALSQAAVFGKTPIFLADVTIRHPDNDNAELFWHCGCFPKGAIKEGTKPTISNHFNRGIPAVGSWEIKGGDITISRFDGLRGNYSLLMGHGKGVSGPKTFGTYGWIEFKDWPTWEHRFINGPYIHHCVGVHAKIAPVLYEACKYIPGLDADPVDPTAEEIQKFLRG